MQIKVVYSEIEKGFLLYINGVESEHIFNTEQQAKLYAKGLL